MIFFQFTESSITIVKSPIIAKIIAETKSLNSGDFSVDEQLQATNISTEILKFSTEIITPKLVTAKRSLFKTTPSFSGI